MRLLANIHHNIRHASSWGASISPSNPLRRRRVAAWAGVGMLLLAPAPSAADQASAPLTFVISDRTPDCLLEREGQPIDDAALKELAERYGRREVVVSAKASISYRCVGGAVYRLQQAGFMRVTFHGR
ncbi:MULTISPECIES: hypothetical protein [Sphingomonas]|uniref:Uncharacterized protein n=2 Tax=Sphingomonas paucimobilis TaxID=13689 RepID=A0A411LIF9_SPHPI|nr:MULTISPECIES: hypothetical protein [Sphingomonas]MBQ1479614.1 hypothetical protein [Sphingomonas sp.]MCM3678184.1 hypothetical protein [Sphingomonas paucimobilis]NNG59351.1 hypothetical protein [Sphingomonas paucimobilis]QBE92117.1 hypothetical protein DRN02_008830 [Sphingomonas paucimobilis]QPS17145.1 hypothetical protein I6G65_05815 [Sphingomonas paucimobilis]